LGAPAPGGRDAAGRPPHVPSGEDRKVRAVILLAGRVGENPFAEGIGRPVLDLPVTSGSTVLGFWVDRVDEFAAALGLPRLTLLVAVDQGGALPRPPKRRDAGRVEVEVVLDPGDYRGTAGVVKDLTRGFAEDDRVLVAAANQIVREPLRDVFEALCRGRQAVSILPYEEGEFAEMFLFPCGWFREVPDVGFADLKEQAIPAARDRAPLTVARRPEGSALPIRTLHEYVQALRVLHAGTSAAGGVFAESWRPVFSIVEPGAVVAPGAVLQDSVVLAGGSVEAGAAVAASVVCDGGIVRRGESVVKSVVTAR
jgi:hypothetical protein